MAEVQWPVCKEEAKANVQRPWPLADDTADRPLRPGRLPSTSERIAWERADAARGLWLCCVGRPSLGGKKGSHPFLGIGLPPRLARDPSALPPFRKFISAFALDGPRNRMMLSWNGQGEDFAGRFQASRAWDSCGSVVIERLEEGISGSAFRKSTLVVGPIPDLGLWS